MWHLSISPNQPYWCGLLQRKLQTTLQTLEPARSLCAVSTFRTDTPPCAGAGGLAFAIRSGVNFFLLLFRITRTSRKARTALVLHALFGADSFRFAATLGTFVAIYKFLINALPLASLPADFSPPLLPRTWTEAGLLDREARADGGALWEEDAVTPPEWIAHDLAHNSGKGKEILGGENGTITMIPKVKTKLSAQAVAHEIWVRKRGRRWHAFLAGALGGSIAIMFEKRGQRVGIAQQMFVRYASLSVSLSPKSRVWILI